MNQVKLKEMAKLGEEIDLPITQELLETYETADLSYETRRKIARLSDKLKDYDIKVSATTRDNHRYSGSPDYVFEYADTKRLKEFDIEAGALYGETNTGLKAYFRRSQSCEVVVRSPHRDWLVFAANDTKRILMRNFPWYGKFRKHSYIVGIVFLILMVTSLGMPGNPAGTDAAPASANTIVALIFMILIVGTIGAVLGIGLVSLWNRVLVAFEVAKTKEELRAQQLLKIFATALTVALGIIIPIILNTF